MASVPARAVPRVSASGMQAGGCSASGGPGWAGHRRPAELEREGPMASQMTKKWALQTLILHAAERARSRDPGPLAPSGEDRRMICEAICKLYRDAYGR